MSTPALIFDMDGVLLDSERVYQEIEQQMFRDLGIPVTEAEHRRFMGSTEKALWGHMVDHYKLSQPIEQLIQDERLLFIERLEDAKGIPLIPGLLQLLEQLRADKVPMMVASSSAGIIIRKVLEQHKLKKFFQGFVSGEEVPRPKPAPDIFIEAAARLDVPSSSCLVIEDSVNGVKAAINAGMKVIGIQSPGMDGIDLSDAHLIVRDHTEIKLSLIYNLLGR